jgi:hypothetical protein
MSIVQLHISVSRRRRFGYAWRMLFAVYKDCVESEPFITRKAPRKVTKTYQKERDTLHVTQFIELDCDSLSTFAVPRLINFFSVLIEGRKADKKKPCTKPVIEHVNNTKTTFDSYSSPLVSINIQTDSLQ